MALGGTFGKGSLNKTGLAKAGAEKSKQPRAKSARDAKPADVPVLAMSLLGRWSKVSQGHIAFGGGCSCGGDFGPIHMSQMEMHVMDYLASKYADNAAIQRLLVEVAGYKPNEAGQLGEVLKAFAMRSADGIAAQDQLSILVDLERSIESLDEITRGR